MRSSGEMLNNLRVYGDHNGGLQLEVLLDIRDLLNSIDTRMAEAAEGRVRITMKEPTIKPMTPREFRRVLKTLADIPKRMAKLSGAKR